eukprot:CAMPEP_0181475876 /NCGR_PEP_ID=MMETSP1110-20121109/41416_1 /TAXON_ID=174948 /ORGANISM="Symbiodinium sp., Strain CCMP421" /LENGTH=92 /DNA_ID=CAMNT_0023601139 /DNA_START=172 /DNA_END=450 /DNA_ORIENTATION=+
MGRIENITNAAVKATPSVPVKPRRSNRISALLQLGSSSLSQPSQKDELSCGCSNVVVVNESRGVLKVSSPAARTTSATKIRASVRYIPTSPR